MGKCFALVETMRGGRIQTGCDILNRTAFEQVQRKFGGCCVRNCKFYKEDADQIRSDIGIYNMSDKQKRERDRYYELNYKGRQNVR